MDKTAYLVLENGKVFTGKYFGAEGDVVGELVFTTGMIGYLETLSDPCFSGQIVVQTFPLIGNYGVIPADLECAKPQLKAYIVREWCQEPSNFRSEGCLDIFLKENGVVAIYGVDTRELTRCIREHGVMNAKIVSSLDNLDADRAEIASYKIVDAVKTVSCGDVADYGAADGKLKVGVWNFGAYADIAKELGARGCQVQVLPYDATAEDILGAGLDGLIISGGPGDPAENTAAVEELKKLLAWKPIFGIGLGHQLLALAHGGATQKMKYGHRGANQPVMDVTTGQVYITSQNHGYEVVSDPRPADAEIVYINVNDQSCEGLKYTNAPHFSVQFQPNASGGPLHTIFLYDRFVKLCEEVHDDAVK